MASAGQQLFNNGVRQGSFISSEYLGDLVRESWLKTLPKLKNREKVGKFPKDSIVVVLTQNCDIACNQDHLDDSLELAICKRIDKKCVHPGNQFVKSVRRLHFDVSGDFFEASIESILTIKKEDILELFDKELKIVRQLSDSDTFAFALWRSNRYIRTALPDSFNIKFFPIFKEAEEKLVAASQTHEGHSFIRSIYIHLNSLEELETYEYELFALLAENTPESVSREVQNQIEEISMKLEEVGYQEVGNIFADREDNITVSFLKRFVRFNADDLSISTGDTRALDHA